MRGGFIMKRIMKVFVVMMVLLAFICVMGEKKDASAKVKRYKLTMGKNGTVLKLSLIHI